MTKRRSERRAQCANIKDHLILPWSSKPTILFGVIIGRPAGRHLVFKWTALLLVSFIVYLGTVSAIPSIERHMAEGSLVRFRSPVMSVCLRVYEAPGYLLSAVPGLPHIYNRLVDFWLTVTDAPDTTV